MDVLLIMNDANKQVDMRVLVKLQTKALKDRVLTLIDEGREKDAFNLIVKRAEVKTYIPPGSKTRIRPELTLVEDLL